MQTRIVVVMVAKSLTRKLHRKNECKMDSHMLSIKIAEPRQS